MEKKYCLVLGIILHLTIVSESRVLHPPALSEDDISGNEEIPLSINSLPKDKDLGLELEISDGSTVDDGYDFIGLIDPDRRPSDYYYIPDKNAGKADNIPGTNPKRFPSDVDQDERPEGNPIEKDDADKSEDDHFNKPLDEKDSNKSDRTDTDEIEPDEEKPIYKDADDSKMEDTDTGEFEEEKSEEKPDEEREEEEKPEEKTDEEREEEEEKDEHDRDNEKKHVLEEPDDIANKEDEVPIREEDDKNDGNSFHRGIAEFFRGGSIFDTAFYNLEQARRYFSQLEKALKKVFSETVEDALLLNGTYTNTTEEEVDIHGKKYIVTKSVIKGADNHSSLYVEALSSKPKLDDAKVLEDADTRNMTIDKL